jgi:hypothetical protein
MVSFKSFLAFLASCLVFFLLSTPSVSAQKALGCEAKDSRSGEDAWRQYGFNHLLFTWNEQDINADTCLLHSYSESPNYLCDTAQLNISLSKKVQNMIDSIDRSGENLQAYLNVSLMVLMLEPLPDASFSKRFGVKALSDDGKKLWYMLLESLPPKEEYFQAPGLYALDFNVIATREGQGLSFNDLNLKLTYSASVADTFPEAKLFFKNSIAKLTWEQRKRLFGTEFIRDKANLKETQEGRLLTLGLADGLSINFTPLLPTRLKLKVSGRGNVYYGLWDKRFSFLTSDNYRELGTPYFIKWSVDSSVIEDTLQKRRIDKACDGWLEPRDLWLLEPAQDNTTMYAVVFLPEQLSLVFPCAVTDAKLDAEVFNGRVYAEHTISLTKGKWFGAGNLIRAGYLDLPTPSMPSVLNLLRRGALCVRTSDTTMSFFWNRQYFLDKQEGQREDDLVLKVPYDAERNVLEHEGLLVDAFGISQQGSYLFKAAIPQQIKPESPLPMVKLTIAPVRLHSAIKEYFKKSEEEDFVIECYSAASGITGAASSPARYVYVAEGVVRECDLRPKDARYTRLSKIFQFKVTDIQNDKENNMLLIFISFRPSVSGAFSFNPIYLERFVSTFSDLERIKKRYTTKPSSVPFKSEHKFKGCSETCHSTNQCVRSYCDEYKGVCTVVPLKGQTCNGGKGVCDDKGRCVSLPQEKPKECKHVTCISSECTRRYADPNDDCKCKEEKLNGKECDGGKGICDNGVCKKKEEFFPSTTTVRITLTAPYSSFINYVDTGPAQIVDASHVQGQGTYKLYINRQYPEKTGDVIESIEITLEPESVSKALSNLFDVWLFELRCYEKSKPLTYSDLLKFKYNVLTLKKDVIYTCDIMPKSAIIRHAPAFDLVAEDIAVSDDGKELQAVLKLSFLPIGGVFSGITKNISCDNVECSSDLKNCVVSKCYRGRCITARAPVGTVCGPNMVCNLYGQCVSKQSPTIRYPATSYDTYILVFIPVSWRSSYEKFKQLAEERKEHFIRMARMEACRDKFKVFTLAPDEVRASCSDVYVEKCMPSKHATRLIDTLEECAMRLLGIPYNAPNYRVVGLTDADELSYTVTYKDEYGRTRERCSKPLGYTRIGKQSVMALAGYVQTVEGYTKGYRNAPHVVTHELGHTFGFCEQYSSFFYLLQTVVYQLKNLNNPNWDREGRCPNYYPGEIRNKKTGKLIFPYKKCPYNVGEYVTSCPDIEGIFVDCLGRKIPFENMRGRDAMGPGRPEEPRPFDCFELDVIHSKWGC